MHRSLVANLKTAATGTGGSLRRSAAAATCPRAASSSNSNSSLVTWELENHVATITLNDPRKLNRLTVEMGRDFRRVVNEIKEACSHDEHHERTNGRDVRAAVLVGAGQAFSAGGDTSWLLRRHDDLPQNNVDIMMNFYKSYLCIRELPVPVVCAINGAAIGAGLCLAMACDLRVASATAKLGLTFSLLGIHPGMGSTFFLPNLVGPQVAKRLLLTGQTITGAEAQDLGLVTEAVEANDVTRRARLTAEAIAEASPVAVQTCTKTLRMREEESLERALQREADAQAVCYASKDILEGILAVKEKRRPNFKQ